MSKNIIASMEILPVELLHRIFDHLDAETIIFSLRSVCRLFRSIVTTYNRYIFNTKLISKSNFVLLCRLIKPYNIISLILSNDERTSNQIDWFISLVHLRQLTHLRSLTLLDIDEGQLNFIMKRINLKLLTFFSFTIRKYDYRRMKTTTNLLASTLTQSNLRQFEFDIIPERISKMSWPFHCTMQYLTINNHITINNLLTILQCSPHLHTIIMKKNFDEFHTTNIPIFPSHVSFPQITSLTIENLDITIDKLESFLLLTPSLIYLKLIGGQYMLDGKRWEQFIGINLLQLDKFEFFFHGWYGSKKTSADLELIMGSFQTPFWMEHKKWFITCEYSTGFSTNIHLYSIPICKTALKYEPEFKKLSLSTGTGMEENESAIMSHVKSLTLIMNKITVDNLQEKVCSFPEVTELNLEIWEDWPLFSLQSLPVIINITQIVQIKLKSYYLAEFRNTTLNSIDLFLTQAYNLSSLIIDSSLNDYKLPRMFNNLYPILPPRLKHLQIPINSVNQIKMILEKCEHLSTMKFDIKPKYVKEFIQWFNDNTIHSTCRKGNRTIIIWLGKKNIQSTDVKIDNKRIKLTDSGSDSVVV